MKSAILTIEQSAPFDHLAGDYDETFSETLLGTMLRDAVHEEMSGAFKEGDDLLDLGCGTGEDARRLGETGVAVYGVDASTEMLRLARAKNPGATFERADLESLRLPHEDGFFAGALANFGAINALRDRRPLARELARVVRPGGRVFLVVMGRFCTWEWLWYGLRGQIRSAVRRLRGSAMSTAGSVFYPTTAELVSEFNQGFEHIRTCGIGVLLPPTFASDVVDRHELFFRRAARLERRLRYGRLASALNDHYLIELRRREKNSGPAFICPSCRAALQTVASGYRCTEEDLTFERRDGILHLLDPARADALEQFVREYDIVRRDEGRGADTPQYYRALPFEDTTGRFARDWRIRAASFRTLLREVVEPLERRQRTLRILDLGAGSGWLSYRMARRSHEVFAVDLRTDGRDGLGAHKMYDAPFTPVVAEFDRLPFADGSFDLVIFNASFHYSENYETTLRETLRVLGKDGRIAVVDSPIYERPFSGSWMVARRERAFEERYGFRSNSIRSENYLTPARLRALSAATGITWSFHTPFYGIRPLLRRAAAKLRRCCEPARFAVIEGRPHLDVERDLRKAHPCVLLRSVTRSFHRFRRLLSAPQRGRRIVDAAGLRFDIHDGVFDPVAFRTGSFLADLVRGLDLQDRTVLDLGTGSGVCGIVAALWGARVTATDVNPRALECARQNVRLYEVDMDVRRSDLFDELADKAFDVILFNPPYFRGEPAGEADRAWRTDDIAERFCHKLPQHLTDQGYALVVLSTDGACSDYLRIFDRAGLRIARVARRRLGNETISIYRLTP